MNTNHEKEMLFLIYAAGFEAGYGGRTSLTEAFDRWYTTLLKMEVKSNG